MTCEQNGKRVGQKAARPSGITGGGSRGAYIAQASFFAPPGRRRPKTRRTGKNSHCPKAAGKKKPQPSLLEAAQTGALPTQRQFKITNHFTPTELDLLSVELAMGLAAVSRRVREVESHVSRGIMHGDPRPLDWARLDREQFQWLNKQLARVRRPSEGNGSMDLTGLSEAQLGELWAFAKFETERATRNIEQLAVPGGPIGGPSAEYLTHKLKLEARFYSLVALQIEKTKPLETLREAAGLSAVGLEDDYGV